MTANDKYSYRKRGSLTQHIQMHFSWKQKGFSQLFCAFFKTALNFENLEKKTTLIPYVFPKLRTPKDVVR